MSAIFTVCWISEASIKCLPFNLNLSKGEEKIVRRSQVWSVAWMIQLCDPLFCCKNRWLHCKARPILVSRDDEKNAFTVGKRYALQLKMKMIAEVFALYKEKRCNWGGEKIGKIALKCITYSCKKCVIIEQFPRLFFTFRKFYLFHTW